MLQAGGSEPSSFVLVPLSKIGALLLASLGGKGKNRNSLACLRNAGSYSALTYCNIYIYTGACAQPDRACVRHVIVQL